MRKYSIEETSQAETETFSPTASLWTPDFSQTPRVPQAVEVIGESAKSADVKKAHAAWDHVHKASRKGEGLFLGIGGIGFGVVRVNSMLTALQGIGAPAFLAPLFMAIGILGFVISMGFTAVITGVNAYRGWRLGERIEGMVQGDDPNRYAKCLEYLQQRAQCKIKGERLKMLLHPRVIAELLEAKPADAKAVIEKVQADRAKRVKMALLYCVLSVLGVIAMSLMLKFTAGPIFMIASAVTLLVTVAWPLGEMLEVIDAYKNEDMGRGKRLIMFLATALLIGAVGAAAVLGDQDPKSHIAVLGAAFTWIITQAIGTLLLKREQANS